jgi:hypothetical protein
MAMTTEHKTLDEALAAAQADFALIPKDRKVDAGPRKYVYADLAGVLSVVRPALAKQGLALTQRMRMEDDTLMLRTELRGYGDSLASEMPIVAQLNNPQAVGSYLTYARRYALCSLVGVAADEDDDGEIAKASPPDKRPRPEPRAQPDFVQRRPADPLPPRAAVPVDNPYDDVGEHTFKFGSKYLTGPEWLDAISRRARDPAADPKALEAWWKSEQQVAERARFHKLKHELNPMLKALTDEVVARFQPAPAQANGRHVDAVDALRA